MKLSVSCHSDPSGTLIAAVISGHGRNEVQILPTEESHRQMQNKIEFEAEEEVKCVRWIEKKPEENTAKGSKRSADGEIAAETNVDFCYLAILLTTGEILVYSPLAKEYTNKMSNESPLSCICYGGAYSQVMGFDPATSTLKKYNVFDSMPLATRTLKMEKGIDFIEVVSAQELVLASTQFHLYNKEEGRVVKAISAPKSHQNQITQLVRSIQNDRMVAISRADDYTINLVSLDKGITATLRCEGKVTSMSVAVSQQTDVELLFAVTDRRVVNVFKRPFQPRPNMRMVNCDVFLDAGEQFGFDDLIVEGAGFYKAVYFDNFELRVKRLHLGDLSTYQGRIPVDFEDESGSEAGNEAENEAEKEEKEEEEVPETMADEMPVDVTKDVAVDDVDSVVDTAVDGAVETTSESSTKSTKKKSKSRSKSKSSNIDSESEMDIIRLHKKLLKLKRSSLELALARYVALSKETVYLLSDNEALVVFKKIAMLFCQNPEHSAEVSLWLKWILLYKGSLLAKNKKSVEVLQLLKSTLSQDIKLLPGFISLEGRLSLLQAQLKLRQQMVAQEDGDAEQSTVGEDSRIVDSTVVDSTIDAQ